MCQSEPEITYSCIRVLVVSSVRVRFLHKTLMSGSESTPYGLAVLEKLFIFTAVLKVLTQCVVHPQPFLTS